MIKGIDNMNQDQNQEQSELNATTIGANQNPVSTESEVQEPVESASPIENVEVAKPSLDSILNGEPTVLESTTPEVIESLEVEPTPEPVKEETPSVSAPVVEEVSAPVPPTEPSVEQVSQPTPVSTETPAAPIVESIPVTPTPVETQNSTPIEPTATPETSVSVETLEQEAPTVETIDGAFATTETLGETEPQIAEVPENTLTPEPTPIDDFNAVPVPPVLESDGKGKKQKGNSKKTLIVVLLILLVALVGFGVYTILTMSKTSATKSIQTKEVKVELGSALNTDISTYATLSGYTKENCNLNLSNVDTTKVSTYKYTVTCGKASEEGLVIVDDTTKPEVVTTDLILLPNAEVKPEDFVEQCVDASACSYAFESEINTKTIGEQTITIIVSDAYNNKNNVIAKLTISNTAPSRYLTCTKEQESLSDINAVLKDSYKIGIDSSDNFYNAERISEFTFNSASDYENVENSYDESVGIHAILGTATFNTSSNKIILKASKTMEDLNKELNGNLPKNSNILRAFLSGLGYICN